LDASAFLRPRAIAIVGASDNSRWSRAVFDNLTGGGFPGRLGLVNRRGGTVHGRPAATSCAELGPIDLGLVLVPAPAVEDALRDLAAAGARAAIVLTSGFAESGEDGAARQRSLAAFAQAHAIRLLGPNCLGIMNFTAKTLAWTAPLRPEARAGQVGIVSQSGATAYFLADLAHRQGVGLSAVVSTGNEADLDASAFLDALVDDPATRAIALFLETVRDPATFARAAARALAAGKPLVVLKVGASDAIAKSALAHTGALVGDDRLFDGLCRQLGMIRVRSLEDLLATADIAARTGPLRPGGLGIVSNSGGICEIAGDTAAWRGIVLPDLTPETQAALRGTIPGYATPHNPLDLTGGITPEQCGDAVRAVAGQPGIAALLCPWYEVPAASGQVNDRLMQSYTHLAAALNAAPAPGFLVSYTATSMTAFSHDIVAETRLPYLACGLDRAIAGLAGALWWSDRQREAAALAPAAIAAPGSGHGHPRSEQETLTYLAQQGVPVVPGELAADADAAVAAAARLGGAVVLKIASPGIAHKSDIGGVALGLTGAASVRDAFHRVTEAARRHAPAATLDGVLVAPMRDRGIELLVGCTQDAQWGPVLTVGLGGIWVELLADVSLRRLPVHPAEVRRMLAELRGAKMLAGQRGVPPAELAALAEIIARIGAAALNLAPGWIALEVNPLWVRGSAIEALDALAVWAD